MSGSTSKPERVRIVPPQSGEPGMATLTQGTKVVTESGVEIHGVYRVELVADTNDIWTAIIHLHVDPAGVSSILSDAVFVPSAPLKWWQKILARLLGLTLDATSLRDKSRRYSKP